MMKHFDGVLMHNICLSVFVGLLLCIASTAWSGEADTKKEIHVFIDQQVLVAIENGEEIYSFDIVTGRDGKETTAGTYPIFRKHKKYTSKTYGSEMPYTMFFTADGKAIHGTHVFHCGRQGDSWYTDGHTPIISAYLPDRVSGFAGLYRSDG